MNLLGSKPNWKMQSRIAMVRNAKAQVRSNPQNQQNTYRGLQWSASRMPLSPIVFGQDREFIGSRRTLAWNTVLDLQQNLSLIEWMVRLDQCYKTLSEFAPRTDDVVYNRELRAWYLERTHKKAVDVQRRLSFDDMIAIYGGLQVTQGYAAMLKVTEGRFQLFEPWNIARGEGIEADEKYFGVKVNNNGIALNEYGAIDWVAFATGDTSSTLKHRYLAWHDEVIMDGYTQRTADTLWESPLLSVLDKCRDYCDADDFNLIKAKLHSMFVVARYMNSQNKGANDFPTRNGPYGALSGDPAVTQPTASAQGAPPPPPLSEVRTGMLLTMEPGEKMEFLESRTPSTEYVQFVKKVCRDILLVLDIPLSFLDSETANYSSMRADNNRYKLSCFRRKAAISADKREAIKHIFRAGIIDRTMPLLKNRTGALVHTVDSLPFSLVSRGIFMLDAAKEVGALSEQVNAGWMTNQEACHTLGTGDFFDHIDDLAEEYTYAEEKLGPLGIKLIRGNATVRVTADESTEDVPTKSAKTPVKEPVPALDDGEE